MLISLFERCMKRRGVKPSDPYDWEKTPAGDTVTTGLPTAEPPPTAPSTLARHTRITTVDNNQENVEPTDNKEQVEARRRRIETENTERLATDTQTNATRQVDKNCNNATANDSAPVQGQLKMLSIFCYCFLSKVIIVSHIPRYVTDIQLQACKQNLRVFIIAFKYKRNSWPRELVNTEFPQPRET